MLSASLASARGIAYESRHAARRLKNAPLTHLASRATFLQM